MRYITFGGDGVITGAFIQDLHPDHVGNFIEVDDDNIYSAWTDYRVVDGGLELVELVEPAPIVPESITPRQGRIILARYGLLAVVDGYFSGLTDEGTDVAKIEWEYAQEWRRDWAILIAAAEAFSLTSAQIDQMFIEAAQL